VTESQDVLSLFSPHIRTWFAEALGAPTEVQQLAWPRIADGANALVTAPTGSGKTFAAFLWALDRLIAGDWPGGRVRVLYVSPLRALGNDIRRNLTDPLAMLQKRMAACGTPAPEIGVATRTGDTPQRERRQMVKNPPEILITTPESLNILLTSAVGRRLLDGIRTVILDEIHALVDTKRGVHLMTAVERLVPLSGEFQRIALSATVRPLELVARWVAGHRLERAGDGPVFRPRTIEVVSARAAKEYRLEVALPVADPDLSREPDAVWAELTTRLKKTVRSNRSTLIFSNSKRTVEKVARFLNENEEVQLAYSHHGALSRELRSVVEERLKAGSLRAIVATNSLELGIDIGSIDEVALVQPPPTAASALQRLGRAGHRVGEVSRGTLYPLHPLGLLPSAVIARAVLDGDIEEAVPIANPLDVLAQVVVSMTVGTRWRIDDLYDSVRTADAYRHLPRGQFDLVIEMLAGRYATTRLRSLRPLISVDRVDGTVEARPGVERLLYMSGGTIPDRGYFHLRVDGSGAPLGQLDEEFVWERSVGDTFTLGVQTWRVQRITHNDVFVSPVDSRSAMAPFWRAEERDRSWFLSEKASVLIEELLPRLSGDGLIDELANRFRMTPPAAAELVSLLRRQESTTGTLPHRHRLVVEHTVPPSGRGHHRQLVLHTMWGGRINRPFGYALAAAWHERTGSRPEIVHGDDCIVLSMAADAPAEDPLSLVTDARLEDLLRATVEHTGFFGARFREAAGRALLLPRGGLRRRTPLWVNRQRAKELLDAVASSGDFPIVLEAWRSCLHDEFDLDGLRDRLAELRDGSIEVEHVHTDSPSPFASEALWRQTNQLMYEDDVPLGRGAQKARPDLVKELVFASHLRPLLPRYLASTLQAKLQRTAPGYAPRAAAEVLDWLKERVLIPMDEWRTLLEAADRDHGVAAGDICADIVDRVMAISLDGSGSPTAVCAVEWVPRLCAVLECDPAALQPQSISPAGGGVVGALVALAKMNARQGDSPMDGSLDGLLADILAFYGPVEPDRLASHFGFEPRPVREALDRLAQDHEVVLDQLLEGSEGIEVCDRENLERLLRMHRAAARPSFEPLPPDRLPLFLAHHQGLGTADASIDDLKRVLEPLLGLPIPVDALETELLPARIPSYQPAWLDALMNETELEWFGCGPRRIALCMAGERDLYAGAAAPEGGSTPDPLDGVFPHRFGRYSFTDLARHSAVDSAELSDLLWEHAWRGELSTDTFAPVRQAIATGFEVSPAVGAGERGWSRRRPRFDRWRSQRPMAGVWYRLPPAGDPGDALEIEEDRRERARVLIDRYGVLFRELLARELPQLRWGEVFRALRMLELAGEVFAGRFFNGVPGIQFASPQGLRRLQEGLPEDLVWWINAVDPASPCGLGLDFFSELLPRRVAGNHLVFHGRRLVVVSVRYGRHLSIRVAEDHPALTEYMGFLKHLLARPVKPLNALTVETVNDTPAASSAYRKAFQEVFHVTRTPTALRLGRQY